MPGSSLNGIVIGGVSLNDDLSGFDPASGAARYLTQELESTLATPEIRKIKTGVGIDYSGQSHLGQI